MNEALDSTPMNQTIDNPASGGASGAAPTLNLPQDALIIVPVRNLVLFPGTVFPLSIGRSRSQAAMQEAVRLERPVGVLLQNKPEIDEPAPEDLHWVGTSMGVLRYITGPDGSHNVVVRGLRRFRVLQFLEGYPFLVARVQYIEDPERVDSEIEGRARALKERALETLQLLPQVPAEAVAALQALDNPAMLGDVIASLLDIPVDEKQALLETFDLRARLERLLETLTRRMEVLKVSRDIEQRTRESIGDVNRKHVLREQMRQIQKELGDDEGSAAEFEELE
jgi:ATP-dependent Lon protease